MIIALMERILLQSAPRTNNVISHAVSTLKRFVNKDVGHNIFQRSFYDHVIRDEKDYLKIWDYIDTNPQKWQDDEYYQ